MSSCGSSTREKRRTCAASWRGFGVNCKEGNNFDACLIADFADFDALNRYKNDPRHVAVSSLCKSIRSARGAVDYEIPDM